MSDARANEDLGAEDECQTCHGTGGVPSGVTYGGQWEMVACPDCTDDD